MNMQQNSTQETPQQDGLTTESSNRHLKHEVGPPLTRKERTEKKRKELRLEIWNVVLNEWDKTHNLEEALNFGDRYIGTLIRRRPQEKEFIVQQTEWLAEKMEAILKKYVEEKEAAA
jgi:hypothetical protein